MRFETFVRGVVFLAALGWAGYTVADAGSTYFMMGGIVDKALTETSARYRISLVSGTPPAAVVMAAPAPVIAPTPPTNPPPPADTTVPAPSDWMSRNWQSSIKVTHSVNEIAPDC